MAISCRSSSVFRADLGFLTVHLISVLEVILVVGVFWRVVSVGSKLLSLYSQMVTRVAILLDLLYTTVSTSCLFLDLVTSILLDLARAWSWWR